MRDIIPVGDMFWFILLVLAAAAFMFLRRKKAPTRTAAGPLTGQPQPPGTQPDRVPARQDGRPARAYTAPRRPTPTAPVDRLPFASPGLKGDLFTYGGPASGTNVHQHDGPYAVVDVETTGFSPPGGDRIIEIAVARVDANGRIEDEFATLINPEGRDTGPVFVHGITNDAVAHAPTFAEVAPELLARLDGAVVVAHNASLEERFLAAELARAGHRSLRCRHCAPCG